MEPRVVSMLMLLATAVLLMQYWSAQRRYQLERDFGIAFFALGFVCWAVLSLYKGSGENLGRTIFLSTLNNLFFLLAYGYLDYAPKSIRLPFTHRVIYATGRPWQLFAGGLCLTVFLILILMGHAPFNYKAIPDFLLTLFTSIMLWRGLSNTFWVRGRRTLALASKLVILSLLAYQLFFVWPFFPHLFDGLGELIGRQLVVTENGRTFHSEALQTGLSEAELYIKLALLFLLFPLTETWVTERISLPGPEKVKLRFKGLVDEDHFEQLAVGLTLDQRFRNRTIILTVSRFVELLTLANRRYLDPEEKGWVEEITDHNLQRTFRTIAKEKIKSDLNLRSDQAFAEEMDRKKALRSTLGGLSLQLRNQMVEHQGKQRRFRLLRRHIEYADPPRLIRDLERTLEHYEQMDPKETPISLPGLKNSLRNCLADLRKIERLYGSKRWEMT